MLLRVLQSGNLLTYLQVSEVIIDLNIRTLRAIWEIFQERHRWMVRPSSHLL